jgi:uncharacterized Tic20 family protein
MPRGGHFEEGRGKFCVRHLISAAQWWLVSVVVVSIAMCLLVVVSMLMALLVTLLIIVSTISTAIVHIFLLLGLAASWTFICGHHGC